jgi:hypothetical protein
VTITAGTVTLNTNATIAGLSVNGGTLTIGNSTTSRTLTVNGNITVAASSTVNISSNNATHVLNVSGDITNSGTFDLYRNSARNGALAFTGAGTHTIGGASAGTTEFYNVTVANDLIINKTGAAITQTGTLNVTANLTMTAGTLTADGAVTVSTGNLVINAGTMNANSTLAVTAGTLSVAASTALNLANTTTIGGTSSISGTVTHTAATGTRTFTGAVTINNGGTMSESAAAALAFGNDLTISVGGTLTESGAATMTIAGNLSNSGTYTTSTGLHTFSSATAQILGTSAISFGGAVTASNSLTVNKSGTTVTVTGALNVTTGSLTLTAGTLSTNGAVTVSTGNLVINVGTMNANSTLAVTAGTLSVAASTALNLANTATIGGTSSISGTVAHTAATGTRTFTGAVTVNNGGTMSESAAAALAFGSNLTISTGGTLTEFGAATMTIAGNLSNSGAYTTSTGLHTFSSATAQILGTSVISFGGAVTASNSLTLNKSGATVTVTGALNVTTGNLTLTAGTLSTNGAVTVSTGNLVVNADTMNANSTLVVTAGTLSVAAGTALNLANTTTIGGTSSISGTVTHTTATGTRTFTGAVTVNNGGTMSESAAAALVFSSNLTISTGGTLVESGAATVTIAGNLQNDGTLTASTGVHTFTTAGKTFSGANAIVIPSVTISGTRQNNGTLTVATTLAGGSTLTNGAAGILNIGAASVTPTLTATAIGNTVNYTGTSQTLKVTAYHHLNLTGGAETFGTISTVAGNLTLSGTATATTGANLAISGNLTVGSGTQFNVGAFTIGVTGTTSVTGTMTHNATRTKTYTGDVIINNGGSWSESGTAVMNFAGNLQNDGTLTASTGVHTFSGATKTFSGANAIVIPSVTVSGTYQNNGTLTVATALAGAGTLTNGAAGILNIGAASVTPTLTATAVGNTVNYTGTGQTLKVTAYHHLNLTGGAETFGAITTVAGNLTLSGTATATTGANLVISGNLGVGANTTLTVGAFNIAVAGSTTVSGTLAHSSATGTKAYNGNVAINAGGSLTNAGNAAVSFAGNFSQSGTFTSGSGTYTFNGSSSQSITGISTFQKLTINNTSGGITLASNVTVSTLLTLTSGNVTTGANTLIVSGADCTTSISRSDGFVIGNLQLTVPATNPVTCSYPVGDSIGYAPISVTKTGTNTGTLIGRVDSGDHADGSATVGIDQDKNANHYWTLTAGTLSAATPYTATFQFCATGTCIVPDEVDSGAATGNFIVVKKSSGTWVSQVVGTKLGFSTQATGLTGFGVFEVGEGVSSGCVSTAAGGNWDSPATWDHTSNACHGSSGIPVDGDTVTIAGPGQVTLNGNSSRVAGLTVNSGATLTNTGGFTLNLGGSTINPLTGNGVLVNNGTLTLSTGSVTLSTDFQFTGSASSAWTLNQLDLGNNNLTFGASDAYTVSLAAATPIQNVGSLNTTGINSAVTFQFNGAAQVLPLTNVIYPNVVLAGSGDKTLSGSGTFDVRGSFTIGAANTFANGAFALNVGGDFTQDGIFTAGTGLVTLNGSSPQSIVGTPTFQNLAISSSGGVTLSTGTVTVSTLLTLSSGTVTTGTNALIVSGADCTTSISRTGGFVIGNLQLTVPATSPVTCNYPVGDSIGYAPISITKTGTNAGTLIGRADSGDHGDGSAAIGIDLAKNANHYWTLEAGTLSATTPYTATFQFCATGTCVVPTEVDDGAVTGNFIVAKKSSGTWAIQTVGTKTGTTIQATGLTGFGVFEAGNIVLSPSSCVSTSAGGNWNSSTTWDHTSNACHGSSGVPIDGDIISIAGPVTLDVDSTRVAGLVVNSGATLTNTGGFTLNLGGSATNPLTGDSVLTNNGSLSFTTGSLTLSTDFRLTGSSSSAWALNQLDLGTKNLTFGAADAYTVSFAATTPIQNVGSFNATGINSTITFRFDGTAQVLPVTNVIYPKVVLAGSGAKTLSGSGTFDVRGSFSIGTTATFANDTFAFNVAGDFTQDGTFTAGAGGVTLNGGTTIQTISGAGALGFANLTVSNTGGITLARNVTVTSAITGTVTLTSTCPTDYTLTSNGGATVMHSCTSSVISITRVDANPTSAASVTWAVTFSQSVTGVNSSVFSLAPSGVTGAYIQTVTGSGTSWAVTANTGIGSGSLGLDQTDPGLVVPTLTGTKIGEVYTINTTPILAEYRMDEAHWDGVANEVVDSAGSGSAQAFNSASTTDGSRAILGTCRYGVFDNGGTITQGYVQTPLTDLVSDFTVTAWIKTTDITIPGQRILIDDENNTNGYGFSLSDGTAGRLRFYSRGVSPSNFDSAYSLANNTWYFVAAAADFTNQKRTIYIFDQSGVLLDSSVEASAWTGAWGTDAGPVSIGAETNASTDMPNNFHFHGNLDEVRVYQKVLGSTALAAIATQTHTCPTYVDHFEIWYDGEASSCAVENVTVKACANIACTLPLYTGGASVTLSPGGAQLTVDATGSAAGTVGQNAAGAVTLGATSIAAVNATTCWDTLHSAYNCNMPVSACPGGSNFDCIENNATARLYTKLAGVPFSFDVVALNSLNAVETQYVASGATAKSVTVELVDGAGSTACASRTAIASNSLSFAATDAGRKSASMTVNNAYADLRCRVTDAAGFVGCSSDDFSVRPSAPILTTSASAVAPSATDATVFKAGEAFTIGATASPAGYTGTLTLDATKLTAQLPSNGSTAQSGGTVGNLTLNPAVQVNASPSQSNNATWDEAGYLYAAAGAFRDDSFTSVDQAGDCVSSTAGDAYLADTFDADNKIGCSIGNTAAVSFGRFKPDHFDVTVNNNGTIAAACSSGGFTYTGQPMTYGTAPSLTIKPMNAATGGSVTQNYSGSFQKLTASGVTITAPTKDGTKNGKDGSNKTTLSAVMSPGGLANSSGTLTYTLDADDQFTYTRDTNSLVGAYTSNIPLVVSTVSDGEVSSVTDVSATPVAGTLPVTLNPTGVSLRYGRLNLANAYGSELLDLPMPLTAENWNGSGWVKNTDDKCTTGITLSAAVVTGSIANICAWDTGTPGSSGLGCSTAGTSANKFNQPPVVTDGGNFNLNFQAPGTGNTGAMGITATVPGYLRFNWKGAGEVNPTARATFGIYQGNKHFIYFREAY